MLLFRSLVFNGAFWAWVALLAVAGVPILALPRRAVVAYARFWLQGVQFLLRSIVGLDYEVRGRERIPDTPAIFAVKHQSAWETLVLHIVLDDPAIALKRELTRIPFFGWYLTRTGQIRIDRTSGASALRSLMHEARRAQARGSKIVIFPEGTRVAPGVRRDYQPGVAALYLQLRLPVVPVALNSGVYWPRRGFIKRPGRIVLEFLEPIAPGLERKAFMRELQVRLEGGTERLVAEAKAGPGQAASREVRSRRAS